MFSLRLLFLCPFSAGAVRSKLILDGNTCATLTNKGSFSTVPVAIGTPPQTLQLVADSGSNALIVESCMCERLKNCEKDGVCFHGHKSSTFSKKEKPMHVKITFGSGPIEAEVASDQVAVGSERHTMEESLLLMVDKKLEHKLELQGILGLGLPMHGQKAAETDGFLDVAKISRFSMCFNQNGKDGALQLGSAVQMHKRLGSVGKVHWGLEFRGASVGSRGTATFCTSTKAGQATPCGAIIDSGTTLILAPKAHLAKLFVQICDAWPACEKRAAKSMKKMPKKLPKSVRKLVAKVKALTAETATCKLKGMPSLSFHLRGSEGTHETLELEPDDYVIETRAKQVEQVKKWFNGVIPVKTKIPIAHKKKICVPAFKSQEYKTKHNGEVWVFGTPFFYKYTVAYDRGATPPAISFAAGCTSCVPAKPKSPSLLASSTSTRRFLATDPRLPYFNSSLPL